MTTTGDQDWRIVFGCFQEAGVLLVEVGVHLGGHIAAATPGFVTNRKIMHTERFIATIFAAQFCEAGFAVRGHILQPLSHFLWSASAQVAVDVGFRTKDFYQRSEEHTSELQSRENLVCRLLLEKK